MSDTIDPELISLEKIQLIRKIERLRGERDNLDKENDRLLTALNKYEHWSKGEGYIITDAQIDAAWRYMEDHSDVYVRGKIEQALYRVGIVRCDGCHGDGRIAIDDVGGEYAEGDCPDCNGHGWVKK